MLASAVFDEEEVEFAVPVVMLPLTVTPPLAFICAYEFASPAPWALPVLIPPTVTVPPPLAAVAWRNTLVSGTGEALPSVRSWTVPVGIVELIDPEAVRLIGPPTLMTELFRLMS